MTPILAHRMLSNGSNRVKLSILNFSAPPTKYFKQSKYDRYMRKQFAKHS